MAKSIHPRVREPITEMLVIMWLTFWPDVLVAVIGAALTVLIALVTYLLRLRLEERRALQSLIDELHRRRSLAPGPEPVIPNAASDADFGRANASVLSIRDEIRRTRDRVRQIESLQGPLSRMTRACNQYLEVSAAFPPHYAILLGELRRDLSGSVTQLSAARKGVVASEPGHGAF